MSSLKSMTGFGSAAGVSNGVRVQVECRSVNAQRGLEVRFYAPRGYHHYERSAATAAKERFHRGRIEVRLEYERSAGDAATSLFDLRQMESIQSELEQHFQKASPGASVTPSDILRAYFQLRSGSDETQVAAPEAEAVSDLIAQALDDLARNRDREGRDLASILNGLLDDAIASLRSIETSVETLMGEMRSNLEAKILDVLAQRDGSIDRDRVWQEVVHQVDRSDITEEIQRAQSHIEHLRALFSQDPSGPCGREITFYLQEFMRESNTMGSKSSSSALTEHVIQLKTTVEKLREQAANVE